MKRKQLDVNFSSNFISTLADPAWGAVFANQQVSGDAAESLTRAVVSGYITKFGKVIRVTPQSTAKQPGVQGSRVDVEVETEDNEIAIYEVQVIYDRGLSQRNLLSFAYKLSDSMPEGTKHADYPNKMPKIIAINFLCYNLRENSDKIVQPVQLCYREPPVEVADDHIMIFNVQIPEFLNKNPDFSIPLHCWLYTIWQSHIQKKTPEEVVKMAPELDKYAQEDAGFRQYIQRFNWVAADKKARDEYFMWLNERLWQRGVIEGAIEERDEYWQEKLDRALEEKDQALEEKDQAVGKLTDEINALKALLAKTK